MPLKLKSSPHTISRSTPLSELPQLMTEQEVADYLEVPLRVVVRMRYEKRGPRAIRLGSKERVRREDLIAWIDAQAAK